MTLDQAKNIAEIAAFAGAGFFFLYRLVAGYFVTNLSLVITNDRQPSPGQAQDELSIIVTLTKGESGTIQLHDAQVSVHPENGSPLRFQLAGLERLSFYPPAPPSGRDRLLDWLGRRVRRAVKWEKVSDRNPFIQLSPGESTQFSAVCKIPARTTCTIEVIVLGRRLWSPRMCQWRASSASLPPFEKYA